MWLQVCRSVCPRPGKVQVRGGTRTSHRALRRKSRAWTPVSLAGMEAHGGPVPLREARVISGRSETFSTGALELASKAWLKFPPLRLSFLVHKRRDLDLPGPQVPF